MTVKIESDGDPFTRLSNILKLTVSTEETESNLATEGSYARRLHMTTVMFAADASNLEPRKGWREGGREGGR